MARRQASAGTAGGLMAVTCKPRRSMCFLTHVVSSLEPITREMMGLVAGYLVSCANPRIRSHRACLRQTSFAATVTAAARGRQNCTEILRRGIGGFVFEYQRRRRRRVLEEPP